MGRRPLGPLLIVPQFEDMINAPETRISVPPEAVANQILQDPIFGHLSSMWNNIETSQELSLRHPARAGRGQRGHPRRCHAQDDGARGRPVR